MWKGRNQEAIIEGTGGELGGPGSWGPEDAAGLLARASLTIMFPWPLPLGSSALTVLLGALTSLFLWYCYRLGSQDMQALGAGTRAGSVSGGPDVCSQTGPRGSGDPGEGPRAEGLVSRRLRAYARRYSWAGMGRVRRAAHGGSGQAGGTGGLGIQRPGLLFLPDLPSSPFVPRDAQRHDVELLQSSFPAILRDFGAVSWDFSGTAPLPRGWSPPLAPGCYQLLLYQAGRCQPSNCRRCPGAYRALRGLRSFMSANTFGNAGFSVLLPGARLEGRCGPTNARVRCHLGLKIPPGCELVVGGEPQCWAEGHCLLVDDSFLHTVAHNGSPEDGPRVVFIVDLWHPNVAGAERQALDFVFAPDP
ncbi:aspartate beta-hydroxylase domain-containing protein 1 [Cricetulus griseus]|uniref:Aspartate beta-hydroxylase domain containing 1 n=1 Tax=Cricetulus griseus TaxID=10029 RepID=G3I4I6_CRIGR|nr:aspartate beta-hydroxylase domain-containing protein 1 [Cricetulus griseus]XP_027260403.1 aspartate beta-hydroxylase domain-containing protein 1 [Cricetulus griseus]EGW09877.1 Aspartate beta-hydroxylase domain-containing protein 1 [Cricetulus griseus]ERE80188.1 aspartate beta-hydroxylase domain-containing protein 1 [Cricetulus griseus]